MKNYLKLPKNWGEWLGLGQIQTSTWPYPYRMTVLGLSLALLMSYVVYDFIVKKDNSDVLDVALVEKDSPVFQAEAPRPTVQSVNLILEEEAVVSPTGKKQVSTEY